MMKAVSCILLLTIVFATDPFPDYDYGDHFNCLNTGSSWTCCGYTANGENHCSASSEWAIYQGNPVRCTRYSNDNQLQSPFNDDGTSNDNYRDVCCDSSLIDSCGGNCKAFYVWPFASVDDIMDEDGDPIAPVTLDNDWRETYLDQGLSTKDAYDNYVFPVSYAKGVLHYNNDPPVCVYVPGAAGRVIEIKVESESGDNRLCVDDTHDDEADKTDPGQIKTCDEGRLSTCFSDASGTAGKSGYAFIINCDDSCEETSDVHVWFRARFSEHGWEDQGVGDLIYADSNVEMWCDYVLRDYPDYDAFPSDLSPHKDPVTVPDSSAMGLSIVLALLGLTLY